MPDETILSVESALAALNSLIKPQRKSRRWLVEFLQATKADPAGRPLYRLAGRDKLVYFDRMIEAFPCHAAPTPSKKRQRRGASKSAALSTESLWARAAKLTGDSSLLRFAQKPRS
jgi:hypothetical protein